MEKLICKHGLVSIIFMLLAACTSLGGGQRLPVDKLSALPGASVTRMGTTVNLLGTPLQVGAPLPSVALIDAFSMKRVDPGELKGSILLLSIVPSIDTKVCEAQTHYLGEKGGELPSGILRVTIKP
jgi:thiol peroxidase